MVPKGTSGGTPIRKRSACSIVKIYVTLTVLLSIEWESHEVYPNLSLSLDVSKNELLGGDGVVGKRLRVQPRLKLVRHGIVGNVQLVLEAEVDRHQVGLGDVLRA